MTRGSGGQCRRLVLIRPRQRSAYYDPEVQEPLGLEYLAAWRQARGDRVLVLDSTLQALDDRKLARRAAAFRPDIVGFSLTTAADLGSALAIHREFGAAPDAPAVRWLAGGNFVSTAIAQAKERLPAGFVLVPFDGERALDELSDPGSGLADRGETRVHPGSPVPDLDALPFPVRPFVGHNPGLGGTVNLQASRGCSGACRYCASPGMGSAGASRWRGRSMPHLFQEIAGLVERWGVRAFNVVDEDFLGPPSGAARRAREFADEYARRGLDVSFGIQARPPSLSPEVIDLLARAGVAFVFVGIESDDPADLRRWSRPPAPDVWQQVRRLQGRGIQVNAGVLMFHRHATTAGIRRFARVLRDHGLLNFRSAINRLEAMPGSVIYADAVSRGLVDSGAPGSQPLPFLDPAVDALHTDVIEALGPLGPPSMHAACAMPSLRSRSRWETASADQLQHLEAIESGLDDAVAGTLFALLDSSEEERAELTANLRDRNLVVALAAAQALVDRELAPSFQALRRAIRIDAGV